MRRRFPDLAQRPLVESRVCQYENSSNGDLLIGIGEGLITAVTVLAVARTRPDLVYALRRLPARSRGQIVAPVEVGA